MKILKLISYNIHKGFSVNNRTWILPEIRTGLNQLNPDLIFLQEVQGKLKKRKQKKLTEPEVPQTEFLAGKQYYEIIYGKNAVYGEAHHGNSILSQHKILQWQNINVALSKRASRSLLHAVIELPPQAIHIICLHLGLFKAERKQQLRILSEHIQAHVPLNAPLIIAGDFNDWQAAASELLEGELKLAEVHKTFHGQYGKTFPAARPTLKIDRIYYRGLGLRLARVLQQEPWSHLSDHLPMYAELVVRS